MFNDENISDEKMKVSNKSWKLKVSAERQLNLNEEDEQEEGKSEDEEAPNPIETKEHVFMQLEVLKFNGTTYLFARKNGGSYSYYLHLWTKVRENIFVRE